METETSESFESWPVVNTTWKFHMVVEMHHGGVSRPFAYVVVKCRTMVASAARYGLSDGCRVLVVHKAFRYACTHSRHGWHFMVHVVTSTSDRKSNIVFRPQLRRSSSRRR